MRTITAILIMFDLPLAAFFVFIFSTSFRFYFAQFNPETDVYENPIDNAAEVGDDDKANDYKKRWKQ
jgi:hypothetical protein